MRPFILLLTVLATPAFAAEHEAPASEMTCADFSELDIEDQKAALAEMEEAATAEGEVPPESLLAGEERVTALVALCSETPDATIGDAIAQGDSDAD